MGTEPAVTGLAPTAPERQAEIARITYRFLRWLMVLLPALLLVVTMAFAIAQGELEASISAYYGTPVRDVFVGVMVATAACLVAYQGASLVEDYTLNGAGFYAVFVALVPTNLEDTLQALRENPPPGGATAADYVTALRISILCVLLLCVALVVVEFRQSARLAKLWKEGRQSKLFIVVTAAVLFAFLLLAVVQLYLRPADEVTMSGLTLGPLHLRIHDLAAILLLCALAVAVASHAWPQLVARLEDSGEVSAADLAVSGRYIVIFALMVLGGPVVALVFAWVTPHHWVIGVEWWEILLFGVFWVLETARTRTVGGSPDANSP